MGGIITPDPVGSQPIAYPAGIYSTSTPYINDGEKAPYVYDTSDGNYYFLKSVMTWIGTQQNNVSPATDTSGAWTVLENYEAIYTDLLIAPNSLVGGAVFNNNLMFSQRGKNASGGDSSEYHLINTSDPMNTSNSFRPNFLLDFENGEAYFGAGGIHLAADSENSSINISSGSNSTIIDKDGIDMTMGNTSFTVNNQGVYYKKGSTNAFGVLNTGAGTFAGGKFAWNENGDIVVSNGLIVNTNGTGQLGPSITWNDQGQMEMNKSLKVVNADSDYNVILGKGPTTDTTALTITDKSGTKIAEIGLVKTSSGSIVVGFGYRDPNSMDQISLTPSGLVCVSGSSSNYSGFQISPTLGLQFYGTGSGWKTYSAK